ncbi:MAG: hypothetical protein P1V36_14665 [Planctomycetota bacterium]|nr:hypothetical protein [Planctomycetota bacterium]
MAPANGTTTAVAAAPVYNAWTTPPAAGTRYAAMPGQANALQPAPQTVQAPVAQAQPRLERYGPSGMPPPPPPPDQSMPVTGAPVGNYAYAAAPGAVAATAPCDPCAPVVSATRGVWQVPERCYNGCGLPCAQGISMWHVRGVVGLATFAGTDSAEPCIYYGVDIGRTFCGCWGLDLYYRYNSGRFTREPTPGITFKDGGEWHHVGVKFTYEWGIGSSPFYLWGGIGGGYFWTDEYIANDDGPEVFLEGGVAWNLGRNWAIRAGVNAHGMNTSVTRRLPANDGQDRFLWIIAPVIELEGRF